MPFDSEPPNPVSINRELIARPDPITLWSTFYGPSGYQSAVRQVVTHSVITLRSALNRPPTQDELDAFTQHQSYGLATAGTGRPIGISAGSFWAFRYLRKQPHYELFYKGQPGFRSLATFWPTLRESMFRHGTAALHGPQLLALRVLWRLSLGWLFFGTVVPFVTLMNSTMAIVADSRLDEYRAGMRAAPEKDLTQRKRALQMRERARGDISRALEGGYSGERMDAPAQDQIPGGDAQAYDHGAEYESAGSPTSSAEPQPQPQYQYQYQTPQPPQQQQQPSGGDILDTFAPSSSSAAADDDDMSPIAAEHRTAQPPRSQQRSTFQSGAWDRIRSQTGSPSEAQMEQPSRWEKTASSSSGAGAGAGLGTDKDKDKDYRAERRQEKDRAQAEFDRMLDAEREKASRG